MGKSIDMLALRPITAFALAASLASPSMAAAPPPVAGATGRVTAAPSGNVEEVVPSVADPGVRQFDDPNLVYSDDAHAAPLVVFMPGTGGRSEKAPQLLLETVFQQGYRVVYLTYDDVPAVSQTCPRDPNPACSGDFREMRAFGDGSALVSNPAAEAIVPRLTALLRYLAKEHPNAGWSAYLANDGGPAWANIVVSGLSQGAGMAAFIAKRYAVRRVVLFSSPWDFFGRERRLAPWLSRPSATPPERWWAERHARENTTAVLARAYVALGIPANQTFVFNGGLPENASPDAENPYHGSTVRLPAYQQDWRTMFGSASSGAN